MDEIGLPVDILSNGHVIDDIFGNYLKEGSYEGMRDRNTLAPLSKDVSKINVEIIDTLLGECKIYKS